MCGESNVHAMDGGRYRSPKIVSKGCHCLCTVCLLLCIAASQTCACIETTTAESVLHADSWRLSKRETENPVSFSESIKDWLEVDQTSGRLPENAFEKLLESLDIGKYHESHSDNKVKEGLRQSSYRCLSGLEILEANGLESSTLSYENLTYVFPALIQQQLYHACLVANNSTESQSLRPSMLQSFGFGTVSVVVISIVPFFFICAIPSTKRQSYRYIMSSLIALSCSTMLGDAFLHLLPQALGLHDEHDHEEEKHEEISVENYVQKQILVLCALYAFYLFEMLVSGRHHASMTDGEEGHGHGHSHMPDFPLHRQTSKAAGPSRRHSKQTSAPPFTVEMNASSHGSSSTDVHVDGCSTPPIEHCHEHCQEEIIVRTSTATLDIDGAVITSSHMAPIVEARLDAGSTERFESFPKRFLRELIPNKTLGWMVIVGDAIHNAIDGVAIGAAFAGDLVLGLSTSIAILCHEIPHEVGDFAALLTAGVSWRGACTWNVIHSLLSLAGLYIGLTIAADEAARQWVFALTAGMFIYVSLTEMMPELTKVRGRFWTYFLAQNVGLLLGFALMLIIAIFEEQLVSAMHKAVSNG